MPFQLILQAPGQLYEFSESDSSDVEYEEEEIESDEDYERGDDRLLHGNISECAKRVYTNGWKSDLPNVPNDFDYQPDNAPMGIYNSAEEAFSAILYLGSSICQFFLLDF